LTNENGTRDNKATNARTVAICKTVFGINADEVDQSIKQRITRALEVVQYIMGAGFAASDLEISKSGRISVPYVCLNDEPDKEEASKNELKQWEAMKGETVELDGKKGHTIAELQRRARPKPDRHATANTPNKGAEFLASINFVRETLSRLMDEKAGDNEPAPNKEMRKQLFDLNSVLAAYFDADPMEEEEEEKKVVKNTRKSKG
jgi:glutaredoxin